jgi:molybdopterin-guanine dinucleotide biosynthesis protein A
MVSREIPRPILGIFVGGASRRMNGTPKGLLHAPSDEATAPETIVERLCRVGREVGLRVVLVGDAAAYSASGLEALADAPGVPGPLGGLAALLDAAGDGLAIAVACDMPRVSARALARLADHPRGAAVVAPRRAPDAPWEPMFARYDARQVRPALIAAIADGVGSFQGLFARLVVDPLPLDPLVEAALEAWDTPDDLPVG